MKDTTYVTKASGERALFDGKKLRRSLRRAGAGNERSNAIVRAVELQLREGMSTKEIYQMAHRMLRREVRHAAARYSLKHALLAFGPSGFPFEQFIAKLLEADGYTVQTGPLRNGRCVPHEIDVLAQTDGRVLIGECKFHNRQNLVSDVKTPLYIHSRFRDLQEGFLKDPEWSNRQSEGWIFTNTRFTDDALQYGRCAGLHLIAWNTPFDYGLSEWVDRTGLHPVTCLTTLSSREKDRLLQRNLVLARDLLTTPDVLKSIDISPGRMRGILEEAEQLCAFVADKSE